MRLRLDGSGGEAVVEEIVSLRGIDGTPLSGRPPGTDSIMAGADLRTVADGGRTGGGALKIEGLAVVDARHVALVNDNDFGVPQEADGEPSRRTRVWLVELSEPLPMTVASSAD